MMWFGLLRQSWPILAAIGALVIVWIWHASGLREARQAGYAQARAEIAVEIERERQHRREIDREVQRVHEQEIAKIRTAAARELRGRPIRCVLDDAEQVRAGRDPGQPTDGTGDEYAMRADVDLRPAIVRQGEVCEQLRQQLIAIRERQKRRL